MERIRAGKMEPMLDGSYSERTFEGYAWRCDECGLVWDRRRFADSCASRGHRPSFQEGPYGVRFVLNGVPQGNIHYYTRTALRREGGHGAQS